MDGHYLTNRLTLCSSARLCDDKEFLMQFEMNPAYEPITEKEYCCVPAVLQMIQARKGLSYDSQDEIGYQLGLMVPPDLE